MKRQTVWKDRFFKNVIFHVSNDAIVRIIRTGSWKSSRSLIRTILMKTFCKIHHFKYRRMKKEQFLCSITKIAIFALRPDISRNFVRSAFPFPFHTHLPFSSERKQSRSTRYQPGLHSFSPPRKTIRANVNWLQTMVIPYVHCRRSMCINIHYIMCINIHT